MLKFSELVAGQFYIPVFERLDPEASEHDGFIAKYRTDAPVYKYLGGGEFVTEDGDSVNGFYDPEIGMYVNVDEPDGFVQ